MLFTDTLTITLMREARRIATGNHLGQHKVLPQATYMLVSKYRPAMLSEILTRHPAKQRAQVDDYADVLDMLAYRMHRRRECMYQEALRLWIASHYWRPIAVQ